MRHAFIVIDTAAKASIVRYYPRKIEFFIRTLCKVYRLAVDTSILAVQHILCICRRDIDHGPAHVRSFIPRPRHRGEAQCHDQGQNGC